MTLRELRKEGQEKLQRAGLAAPDTDAEILLFEAFDIGPTEVLLNGTEPIPEEQYALVERYNDWIEQRATHKPLQYILGIAFFMGLKFKVSDSVLIPRFDTEVLVENAGKTIQKEGYQKVLDVCTGSGCIAISLAKLYHVDVTAVDLSEFALSVARENAERLLPDGGVKFIKSDMFDKVEGSYDLIVSNPPYVRPDVIAQLDPEVRDCEPRIALDGGLDGLKFYRILAAESGHFLRPGGSLMLEIGCDQADEVSELLAKAGYQNIEVVKDLAGLPRNVCAIWP